MRDCRERILDILEAIAQIEKYAARGREAFESDELIQTWTVHYLEIIGEAVRALPEEFKRKHAEVPWQKIIGMRNILVHHYFGIDTDVVWAVVKSDLPELKKKIEAIVAQEK